MSISTLILILKGTGVLGAATFVFIVGHKLGCRSCRQDYPNGWDAGKAAERERWEQATGGTYERILAEVTSPGPDIPGNDGWPYGFTNLRAAEERREEPPATEVLLAQADAALGKPRVPSVAEVDELAAQWRAKYEAGKYGPPMVLPDAPAWDISEAEFEAAKRDLIERHGAIPPSLQNVIDHGGRFARHDQRSADAMVAAIPDDHYRAPIVADLTGPAAWHYPGEDDVPTLTGLIVTPPRRDRSGPEWLEAQLAAQDSETDAYLRRVEAEVASYRRGISAGAPARLP